MTDLKYGDEYYRIIGAGIKVWNHFRFGLLEKIYANSLMIELRKQGFKVTRHDTFTAWYEGENVGDFQTDIIINGQILLELKTARAIHDEHVAQILNYLNLTKLPLGILLNFGPTGLEHRRYVR